MPKPNFYMSEKDRSTLLSAITNYISMWDDSDDGMDNEEYEELYRVRDKIKNMYNTQGYKNATVSSALEIAKKVLIDKRKRRKFESSTCSTCEHWNANNSNVNIDGMGYCSILKEYTELDESCNDFEDIKE